MTNLHPLILLGGGGHARVVADAARLGGWGLRGYLDDQAPEEGTENDDLPYLGRIDQLGDLLEAAPVPIVIHAAVGDGHLREVWLSGLAENAIVTIFHPRAIIADFVDLEPGIFIGPGAIINAGAHIGRGAIINSGAIVEHDVEVGAFSHIAPGAILAGEVRVGERALIGAGATVLPGVAIGAGVILGAGAVATRDLPEGCTAMGIPAIAASAPSPTRR